jgi:acid phosphatase
MTMRTTSFILAAIFLAAFNPAAAEPANLGKLKTELVAYESSGRYEQDFAAVIAQARRFLDARADAYAKPALVLDIDETTLSNWTEIQANDFAYLPNADCNALPAGPCGMLAWDKSRQAAAFPATLALYADAQSHGVAVFFITGRHEAERQWTEANLRNAGYQAWAGLYMEPDGAHFRSAADFKSAERGQIEAQGYHIVANVGDQQSDLAGGHAARGFKLPNPFYFIQ